MDRARALAGTTSLVVLPLAVAAPLAQAVELVHDYSFAGEYSNSGWFMSWLDDAAADALPQVTGLQLTGSKTIDDGLFWAWNPYYEVTLRRHDVTGFGFAWGGAITGEINPGDYLSAPFDFALDFTHTAPTFPAYDYTSVNWQLTVGFSDQVYEPENWQSVPGNNNLSSSTVYGSTDVAGLYRYQGDMQVQAGNWTGTGPTQWFAVLTVDWFDPLASMGWEDTHGSRNGDTLTMTAPNQIIDLDIVTGLGTASGRTRTFTENHENIPGTVIETYGTVQIQSAALFGNAGTFRVHNGGVLENSGTFRNLLGGVFGQSGLLANLGGATFQNSGSFQGQYDGQFSNAGLLQNLGGASFQHEGTLTNTGTIQNQPGGTFGMAGLLQNLGGASFQNGGAAVNSGSIENAGLLQNLGGASFQNTGTVRNLPGGLLQNLGGASFQNAGTIENQLGGLFGNAGLLQNLGGASFQNIGTMNNLFGGVVNNHGSFTNSSNHTVNNNGVFNVHGELNNTETGVFNNNAGGELVIYDSGWFSNQGQVNNSGAIANAGYVEIGASGTISGSGSYVQSAGMTWVDGRLSGASVRFDGGVLAGNGSVASASTILLGDTAILQPGGDYAAGKLSLDGDVEFGDASVLSIDVLGNQQGIGYDWLAVTGDVSLDGELMLTFDYELQQGEVITLLISSGGVVSGRFDLTTFNGGFGHVSYDTHGVYLSLAAPVPEPQTWITLLAGIGLLGLRLRGKGRRTA
jgi:hypothetical protein